ncbi:hypothetical protein FE257_001237 [Aspergillus nanangensis]|uniref:Amidohydrolase-related domain-containing protein n=1 Tax=Aspergillus nanangensis TaxID=2582783 RepID=A0AAD4CE63_ASPNN|nr:hypothetical protein FE257_001237 [Aspergillus nanangensis]
MEPEKSKPPADHGLEVEFANGQVAVTGNLDMPMKRKFSILSIIAVGYNITNSWVAIAASFAIAIQSGGALSLLYGIILVTVAMLCTGMTLAELASVYPTAGGQYHFTSILASTRWSRSLSYTSGLAGVFAWITLGASICISATQALMAIIIRWQPEYEPKIWHYFLVYELLNAVVVVYNIFLTNKTLWVYNFGFILSLTTFVVITVTCPARASTEIDSHRVWSEFINGSGGWPDGISFLTGLSTPQFMMSGLDATLHLAEECLEPERIVPKAVMVTVFVGFLTAFPFAVGIIYSVANVEQSLDSPTGYPIYYIWEKATRSPAAGTVFMVAIFVVSCVALNAVHQTASRLTWSFARDEALFFSRKIATANTNGFLVAFNAFISSTVIVAQISFAIPAILLLIRRRSTTYLPTTRTFKLPNVVGYVVNVMCIVWAVVLTVFFCFPTVLPVTGGNMNYTSVVLVVMLILGVANWFVYARRWCLDLAIGFHPTLKVSGKDPDAQPRLERGGCGITNGGIATAKPQPQLPLKIDTHHHFIPEFYAKAIEAAGGDPSGWPTPSWSPNASLQNMQENGIQKAILSITAPGATIATDIQSARNLARRANTYAAKLRDIHPDNFGFFATMPSLMDVNGTLAEMTYALDVLKADGVTLFTRYGDGNAYLGHPTFLPIWRELDRRKAVAFIHPTHPGDLTRVNPLLPQPAIDYPQETTRAAVDMIIANITQEFLNCRKILSHAGGTLPYLISRLAMTSKETEDTAQVYGKSPAEIMEDFRSFYYDLALSSSPAVLKLVLELVPHNQILYGSDFPYADTDKIAGFRENLDSFQMGKRLREKIYFGNARRLLSHS